VASKLNALMNAIGQAGFVSSKKVADHSLVFARIADLSRTPPMVEYDDRLGKLSLVFFNDDETDWIQLIFFRLNTTYRFTFSRGGKEQMCAPRDVAVAFRWLYRNDPPEVMPEAVLLDTPETRLFEQEFGRKNEPA
jgi:hypothetical protein